MDIDGQLVSSPEEAAINAENKAIQERQEKELALQENEQLKAKLRELGINPDEIS